MGALADGAPCDKPRSGGAACDKPRSDGVNCEMLCGWGSAMQPRIKSVAVLVCRKVVIENRGGDGAACRKSSRWRMWRRLEWLCLCRG